MKTKLTILVLATCLGLSSNMFAQSVGEPNGDTYYEAALTDEGMKNIPLTCRVYPNPALNGYFTIETFPHINNAVFEIYNTLGQMLEQHFLFENTVNIKSNVDVGAYIYMLRDTQSGKVTTGNIIITNNLSIE